MYFEMCIQVTDLGDLRSRYEHMKRQMKIHTHENSHMSVYFLMSCQVYV